MKIAILSDIHDNIWKLDEVLKQVKGVDALLSTLQMPAGIPVATMAVGKAGARNAGILAVQILALGDSTLRAKLGRYKKKLAKGVEEKESNLIERTGG